MRFFHILGLAALLTGCNRGKPAVTLYSDMDKSVAAPLVEQFQREKQIAVTVVYADSASVQKGIGLSGKIADEGGGGAADVYWAAGPQSMERMTGEGMSLLQTNGGRGAAETASCFKTSAWVGLGARVRVLIYNTQALKGARIPKSIAALTRPEWKGRAAIADPRVNGNANYHLLTYFAAYGETEGTHLLEGLKTNQAQILPDENAVIEAVAGGKADWGVTDSDAATAAVLAKKPVDYVVPDQENFATSDALGQVRGGGVPTLGTPALPFPIGILHEQSNNVDLQKFLEFLFAPQIALKIAELNPNIVMTRAGAADDKPAKEKGRLIHADKLQFTTLGMDKFNTMRPHLNLALSHILGDAPDTAKP